MYSLAQQQPTGVFKKEKRGKNKSPSTSLQGFKGWVNEMNLPSCSEERPTSLREMKACTWKQAVSSASLITFITWPFPRHGALRAEAVPVPASLSTFITWPLNPHQALGA